MIGIPHRSTTGRLAALPAGQYVHRQELARKFTNDQGNGKLPVDKIITQHVIIINIPSVSTYWANRMPQLRHLRRNDMMLVQTGTELISSFLALCASV